MKRKIKLIEQVANWLGLSLQDFVEYWLEQHKVDKKRICKIVEPEKVQIYDSIFSADDIRSRTKLFWYAFEGEKFSRDPKAYPNCQGVVGWINPDPNAPEGERIYVVLPEQQKLPYASKLCYVGAIDLYNCRGNTLKLIEYGKKHNVKFPAAEFAFNYCNNGVKQGEAFLPARDQLSLVVENCVGVRRALKLIRGTFEDWLWSSSETSDGYAWGVNSNYDRVYYDSKNNVNSVSCFLAY